MGRLAGNSSCTAHALLALTVGLAGVVSLKGMATTDSDSNYAARHRVSRPDRSGLVNGKRALTGLATVLALWLGLTAPGVSPVAPTLTAQPTQAVVAQQSVTAATAPASQPGPHRGTDSPGARP